MIYLDYNATTPVDPAVLEQMLPWMSERFWNSSSSHDGGRMAAEAVDRARSQVAALIGARRGEIVWTSGATEANNLALKGLIELAPPDRRRVVTFETEHKAVLDTVGWLASTGVPTTVLRAHGDGSYPLADVADTLRSGDVAVVSAMAANNETGVLADLSSLAEAAHQHGALLHTDATQLVGKLPFDVRALGVDFASFSAHKLYGPKGVGPFSRLEGPHLLRSSMAEDTNSADEAEQSTFLGSSALERQQRSRQRSMKQEARRLEALRDLLVTGLAERLDDVVSISEGPRRLPNTASLRFVGADAEAIMANAPHVAVSSGSACTSAVPAPSHVLLGMGLSYEAAQECIRICVGRPTTEDEVTAAVDAIARAVGRVRDLSAEDHGRNGLLSEVPQ